MMRGVILVIGAAIFPHRYEEDRSDRLTLALSAR